MRLPEVILLENRELGLNVGVSAFPFVKGQTRNKYFLVFAAHVGAATAPSYMRFCLVLLLPLSCRPSDPLSGPGGAGHSEALPREL